MTEESGLVFQKGQPPQEVRFVLAEAGVGVYREKEWEVGHILCRGKSLGQSSETRGLKGQYGWSTGHECDSCPVPDTLRFPARTSEIK